MIKIEGFSSPFIEERLYFVCKKNISVILPVLVPFYRGAVVFRNNTKIYPSTRYVLVPFYRGAVVFIEYTKLGKNNYSSRPLLSRSGCISIDEDEWYESPRGSRPLLSRSGCISYLINKTSQQKIVLVPFYRGAVVFQIRNCTSSIRCRSRPLLSRSGCI